MIKVSTLPNGLTVATNKTAGKTCSVIFAVMTGSVRESERQWGISHLLEHMAFKGTNSRSAYDISSDVERSGCEINAFTSKTQTVYHIDGLVSHVEKSIDILSDVILNSRFDEADLESEKTVIFHEMRDYGDDPMHRLYTTHDRIAHGSHPYAREIIGSKESVRSISTTDIREYMSQYYVGSNMIVAVSGHVDHDAIVDMIEKKFPVRAGEGPLGIIAQASSGKESIRDKRIDSANFVVSFSFSRVSSDRLDPTILLSGILGGGMSSPLFQEVRENRSLCYHINSWADVDAVESRFFIHAATDEKSVSEAIKCSIGELEKIANGNISDFDWDRTMNGVLRQVAQSEFNHRQNLMAGINRFALENKFNIRSYFELENMLNNLDRKEISDSASRLLESPRVQVVLSRNKVSI